jgi:hypothetical protein
LRPGISTAGSQAHEPLVLFDCEFGVFVLLSFQLRQLDHLLTGLLFNHSLLSGLFQLGLPICGFGSDAVALGLR